MRSMKNRTEFFMSMKKKPALQNLIDRIDSLSNEDIDNSMQPRWIKIELKRYKQNDNAYTSGKIIADKMILDSPPAKQHKLETYKYIGETKTINNIEIFNNELLLLIDDEIVKVGPFEIPISKFELNNLQFVETILTVADYISRKLDDDWDRLAPGENRAVTPNNNTNRMIGGVEVKFRTIE